MMYNLYKTIALAPKDTKEEVFEAYALVKEKSSEKGHRWLEGVPFVLSSMDS